MFCCSFPLSTNAGFKRKKNKKEKHDGDKKDLSRKPPLPPLEMKITNKENKEENGRN